MYLLYPECTRLNKVSVTDLEVLQGEEKFFLCEQKKKGAYYYFIFNLLFFCIISIRNAYII